MILHNLALSGNPWQKEKLLSDCQETNRIGLYTWKSDEKRGGYDMDWITRPVLTNSG